MDKIRVLFDDVFTTKTIKEKIYQWSQGLELIVEGLNLPNFTEFTFSTQESGGTAITRIGFFEDNRTTVKIPDEMFEKLTMTDYKIYAYIHYSDIDSDATKYKIVIPVIARSKPDDFESKNDFELFKKVLEEVNGKYSLMSEDVLKAESFAVGGTGTRENEDTDNSKFYAEQSNSNAQATELDRQEVAQNRDVVEQLKQAVEQSEQNARKDAEQVTQDKADITLIAEDVRQNKQSVDLAQADVVKKSEQITKDAQQTAKDVQQTAQNRKAVEDVKTQFTQDVKTATDSITKQTSTSLDAINTKATEQLQAVENKGTEQVKAVEQAGAQFTQELPKLKQDISSKLDRNLGTENTDKVLKVDVDGNVVPVSKTEIVPQGLQEDILKNAVKPIVKGNPVILKDSSDNKPVKLEISGSTSQVQTSGKNLFDISKLTNKEGLNNKGESIEVIMPPTSNGIVPIQRFNELAPLMKLGDEIIINAETTGTEKRIYFLDSKTNCTFGKTLIKVTEEVLNSRIVLYASGNGTTAIISNIQVEIGSEPTPYEPYSGGQPSPSPEYPQEIVNGECDHMSYTGKNLLSNIEWERFKNKDLWDFKQIISEKPYASFKLKVKPKTKYFLRMQNEFNGMGKEYYLCFSNVEGKASGINDEWLLHPTTPSRNNNEVSIISTDDGYVYINMYGGQNKLNEIVEGIGKLQLSLFSTPYEPYKGQTVTFPKIELSKWDKIKKIDGVWKKEIFLKNLSFDELKKIKFNFVETKNGYDRFYAILREQSVNGGIDTINCKSNLLIGISYKNFEINISNNIAIYKRDDGQQRMDIMINSEITNGDFNNFLVNYKDLQIAYKSSIPTYEILPQETQDALNSIETFYPNSVVQTNEGIELDLQYIADTKLYIDGKFAELQKNYKEELAKTQKHLL